MCPALAMLWAEEITKHVAKFVMPYKDPKTLDAIEIEDEDDEVKRYDDGKLHHLKRQGRSLTMGRGSPGPPSFWPGLM